MTMKRDQIFGKTTNRSSDFEFNAEVAEVFDDMVVRSVPLYVEQQYMIRELARKFWIPGTAVYDLGCSTATTLIQLCDDLDSSAELVGYDNSLPMLEQGKSKLRKCGFEHRVDLRFANLNEDLSELSLQNASVVVMCWTLQFIRPLLRDRLVRWIYDGLVENGVLIATEKILTNSTHTNRYFIDLYYDFKARNGYSQQEIQCKREALENVLIPYRLEENLEMFRRNGFGTVETFFQWYNFAGFLCIKTAGSPDFAKQ
jgi:tRNA (cmo5U34)-methyltransferase